MVDALNVSGLFIYYNGIRSVLSKLIGDSIVGAFFQGLDTAAQRIVTQAIIRDIYLGREMAQILSLVMILFTLVLALASLMGDQIIKSFGRGGVFPAFSVFGFVLLIWYNKRLGETLI